MPPHSDLFALVVQMSPGSPWTAHYRIRTDCSARPDEKSWIESGPFGCQHVAVQQIDDVLASICKKLGVNAELIDRVEINASGTEAMQRIAALNGARVYAAAAQGE